MPQIPSSRAGYNLSLVYVVLVTNIILVIVMDFVTVPGANLSSQYVTESAVARLCCAVSTLTAQRDLKHRLCLSADGAQQVWSSMYSHIYGSRPAQAL